MHKVLMTSLLILMYAVANLAVVTFGVWITPFNALVIIGAEIVIRDRIQYKYGFAYSIFSCLAAGVVTVLITPSSLKIAIASVASIVIAGIVAGIAFKLREGSFYKKSFSANIFAAAADSLVFPLVAFGAFMPYVTMAQFCAKTLGASIILLIMRKIIK